jgi:hypothetical protein
MGYDRSRSHENPTLWAAVRVAHAASVGTTRMGERAYPREVVPVPSDGLFSPLILVTVAAEARWTKTRVELTR